VAATPAPAPAAPAPAAVATQAVQPATASASASTQQRAALNQLLSKYKYSQSHNAAAGVLSSLGRQIMAEAKTLGQHVTLPHAPVSSNATAVPPAASAAPATGKVSITA
jgi:hypothetical protein